jgi:hypothetical protein
MKESFPFLLVNMCSLFNILKAGFKGYSTDFKRVGGTTNVYLFLTTGEIVKIYSEMHNIDDWNEIGLLVFEEIKSCKYSKMIPLGPDWENIVSIERLVLDKKEFSAESGILFRSETGGEFLVVTSANVDTLAVRAPFSYHEFLPENDLWAYSYIPLQ